MGDTDDNPSSDAPWPSPDDSAATPPAVPFRPVPSDPFFPGSSVEDEGPRGDPPRSAIPTGGRAPAAQQDRQDKAARAPHASTAPRTQTARDDGWLSVERLRAVLATRRAKLVAYGALGLWLLWAWSSRIVRYPKDAHLPDPPSQHDVSMAPWSIDEFVLDPVARFSVTGVVVHAKKYRLGREADLAPYDIALGWGPMADRDVLEELDFSHYGRFLRYRWSNPPPLPPEEISRHTANIHAIPQDFQTKWRLGRLRAGDVVDIEGVLVNVESPDGWRWDTSTTREDQGAGACEVMWVERVVER